MLRRRVLALGLAVPASLCLRVRLASAHGPTPQTFDDTIMIKAPPQHVWSIVGNFADIAKWHPLVASSDAPGGNAYDSKRNLVLKPGKSFNAGTLVDGLVEIKPDSQSLEWRLAHEDVQVFPVSFYTQKLQVTAAAGGSQAAWGGRYYRGETLNDPPPGLDDDAADAAMAEFIKSGLAGLKQYAEKS